MSFYLGIDGGGTRTRAFAVDAGGARSGWGAAGLGNPNHAATDELRTNIDAAISGALAEAGAKKADCASVFLGMAGVTTEAARENIAEQVRHCGLNRAQLGVDHDIRIALAGGLGGGPGIALIVGTGSSCYGRTADGRTWQTGGWGFLIADEGSGYFLAQQAIVAAARMADGRMAETPLRQRVFSWLGIEQTAELLPRLYEPPIQRTDVAAFAPQVVALAETGDRAALDILDRGAAALAEMVAANHRRLPTGPNPDVVITGGLGTADTIYRRKIEAAIAQRLPTARVCTPMFAPAVGAAVLAMQQGGLAVGPELLAKLKSFEP